MKTSEENIKRLLEMLDNPSAYSEQEISDIINRDDETREAYRLMVAAKQSYRKEHTAEEADAQAAWQRLSNRQDVRAGKPSSSGILYKIAASFIVILMLSGIALAAYHAKTSGQTVIEPQSIHAMPNITKAEWDRDLKLLDEKGEPTDTTGYGDLTVYKDLYGWECSWYCGGSVKSVTASSHLPRIGAFSYEAGNAHDFNHETVWATKGKGIGESLTYTFEGSCPRITKVKILNGHVKNERIWQANSRVKRMRMYFDSKPIATLSVQDSRTLQTFDVDTLGYHDRTKPDWTLRFEILDVYPGTRHDDTVIAELYFDGIDVH